MTDEQLRHHATEIILDHARDVVRLSIWEHLGNEDIHGATGNEVDAISKLIDTATISVDWPAAGEAS